MTGWEEFLAGTIRLATPLVLAALGEVVVQRAGVINISIEGMMLTGAFAGFACAALTGSALAGVAAAALSGLALAALFSYLCISRKSDQIVIGMGINIAALGLTGSLYRAIFGIAASPGVPRLPEMPIGPLKNLPVVGEALFSHSVLVYAALAAAIVLFYFLRAPSALGLKACGANPEAADAAGVNVEGMRWAAVLWGGLMAGTAGAFLSLVQASTFTENMSSGRGFIALAVVIFGRWNPLGILVAGMLFGGATEAQFWVQGRGGVLEVFGQSVKLPYQMFLALPYVVTLVVLTLFSSSYRGPRVLGKPYVRSS